MPSSTTDEHGKNDDNCQQNNLMSKPDFNNFKRIALDPSANSEPDPSWNILRNGTAVSQSLNSSPGLAVGQGNLEGINFEGNLFVDTMSDVGYIGFVFSYQDNSKFYVVMWKKSRQVYWKNSPFTATATAGIQLKLVNSIHGPGEWLRNSLWHSGDTKDHVKLLWQDPKQQSWQYKVNALFASIGL